MKTIRKIRTPTTIRLRAIKPNAGIEVWYRRQLERAVDDLHRSTVYWIKARYRSVGLAQDASPAIMMRDALRKLARRWQRNFDELAEKLADRFARDVMKNSDVSLAGTLEQAGFSVPFRMTSAMNNALQASITENVGLIRSIASQYHSQVETLVMQSVSRGRNLESLTHQLQQRYGVTRRRAAFIALDQNNKATSAMQAARQQSIGIMKGRWRHSHAGKKPRQSHVKADGKEFDLSKGMFIDGEWIMPGEKPRCRCTWDAIMPALNQVKKKP